MSFDLTTWKASLATRLRGWLPRMQQAGVTSVYAFVSAASLWPVVEAAQHGEWAAAAALGTVTAGVGTNLLANKLQGWKDEATAARALEAAAERDTNLRAELDAVLQKLDALAEARDALPGERQAWFDQTLRQELVRLGSTVNYNVTVAGPGPVAIGDHATALGAGAVLVQAGQADQVQTGGVRIGSLSATCSDVTVIGGDIKE